MYNSDVDQNQNDADLTMIDQSYLYDDNDGPTSHSVVRHIQRANHCWKSTTNADDRHDYVYVEHDRLEAGKQIEQILQFYRQDLGQKSSTQLDCDQQLMTRLMNFLRGIFSTDEKKMENLETLYEEIANLQDIRFIAQTEKTEGLTNELLHLKKVIITTPNDKSTARTSQSNSMISYEQWMEIEEESKKLQRLVETQRNKIDELVKLVLSENQASPDEQWPTTTNPMRISTDRPSGTVTNNGIRLPPSDILENCPICKHNFPPTTTELEFVEHMENCVFSSPPPPLKVQPHKCPYCQKEIPGSDEVYLEHVSRCLNE